MLRLIYAERKSEVLASSSLSCLSHIPAINLTSGCAHSCVYCYARGYSSYPGEERIVVYANTLLKLKKEIYCKRIKPQAVYFSPSSDIFQPVPVVRELGHSVLEYLLSKDIGVAFLTKGQIPENTMRMMLNHADKVRAQIGIITPDDSVRKIFEPNAASINVRLQQMKEMIAGGLAVEARLMPILPGITDTYDSLTCLFGAIADVGVKQVAISTLFIRPSIAESLIKLVPDKPAVKTLLNLYNNMGRIGILARNSSVVPLPRLMREKIYTNIKQIAKKYDIEVSICGCMNPDIGGTCNITGRRPFRHTQPSLL